MTDEKWLAGLKAGDEVAIISGYTRGNFMIDKVDRTTATQIILGSNKYRRDTGRRIGQHGYYISRIVPVTDEIRRLVAAQELGCRLQRLDTKTLTMEQITAISVALSALSVSS